MARPNQSEEQRTEMLPLVSEAFGELGYRRATTAELAARCGVRENILYRLWPDKKAMFVAAIDYLFERRMERWRATLSDVPDRDSRTSQLLKITGENLGEDGLYRIIFAAMCETHDPDIKRALQSLYKRYHQRITDEVHRHREQHQTGGGVKDDDIAWAMIGLVTFMNTALELDLMGPRKRQRFFQSMASVVLGMK